MVSTSGHGTELSLRSQAIVRLILPGGCSPETEAAIGSFIRQHGYGPTLTAAGKTAEAQETQTIRKPWRFLVAQYTDDHAKANVLQGWLYWLETSLRSRIDL